MDSSVYNLYIKDVIQLSRSLVIKSEETAQAINDSLQVAYGTVIDEMHPETWKYYLNLNGQYHAADLPYIRITSLDTLEEIDFTKENMEIHRTTFREYAVGNQAYTALVAKYPDEEDLIRGVVAPIDIDRAINADNHTVLGWTDSLIEATETNLIPQLQSWINGFQNKHNTAAYSAADDLYVAANLGLMYLYIPNTILNIRLNNCKTPQVHSFHLWTYLRSNGNLDNYRGQLDDYQALYLYRNIRWIMNNAGKQSTFESLVRVFLSRRNLSLFGFDIAHNLETMPETLYPDVDIRRYRIDETLNSINFNETREVSDLLNNTVDLARDNPDVVAQALVDVPKSMQRAHSGRLPTKTLESELTEIGDDVILSFDDLLLNQWAFLASRDYYRGIVNIPILTTGVSIKLSPLDALTLYIYTLYKAIDIELVEIPSLLVYDVRRIDLPTLDTLMGFVQENKVSKEFVANLLNEHTVISQVYNNELFHLWCQDLYDLRVSEIDNYSAFEYYDARAQAESVTKVLYCDAHCTLSMADNYSQFLQTRDIDLSGFGVQDYLSLSETIFKEATGKSLNLTGSTTNIQRAMLDILSKLSSYALQFIATSLASTSLAVKWTQLRLGEPVVSGDSGPVYLDAAALRVEASQGSSSITNDIDQFLLDVDSQTAPESVHSIDIPIELNSGGQTTIQHRVLLPLVTLNEPQ
ncbi:hypothetical protein [Endozoicomonas sp. ONNA1]|uniref:hypothetical protein n=1 Tax=Endozoicomonas sp. ONNA1 TaxID=2828740 RepID=UPI0021477814|nr:hypothetical protein [Endozoicomonas sp. ONNA1]